MRRLSERLIALTPGARLRLVALVVLMLLITGTYVGQGLLIARTLGSILQGGALATVLPLVAGILVLQVARVLLTVWREELAMALAGRVKAAVRARLTSALFELGPGWLQRTRTGTVQSTVVDGVETLDPLISKFVPQAFATAIGALGVTAYLIVLDPVVGCVVLVCAVVAPVLPVVADRFTAEPMAAWFDGYRGLYAEFLDAVQGMATLKAFNASAARGAELEHRSRVFARDSIRLNAVVIIYIGVVALVVGVGTAFAIGIGAVRLANGEIGMIELLTILMLAGEAFRPLQSLEKAYHGSYRSGPAGEASSI
ncbi:hypothetical protein BJF78_13475 [Pseudonocardia sp. CNS-139]|nr:hypothetical protein BJF78_13475 [Pseudonocardia sp. CNS-139]